MLILSLAVNLLVLIPLCYALFTGAPSMEAAYGPATPARGILTSVYLAILLMSLFCLALIPLAGMQTAIAWALPLLAVQIIYKSITGPLVGLGHPVVQANLAITALHIVTAVSLLKRV